MTTVIYFDGACEYNPQNGKRNPGGIATYGWLIKQDDTTLAYGYGEAGRGDEASNNIAEYQALIEALKAAQKLGIRVNEIRGDSQLVIYQVNGTWKCNKPHLIELRTEAHRLLDHSSILYWVPREENQEADDLSKKAYNIARNQAPNIWQQRFRVTAKERVR